MTSNRWRGALLAVTTCGLTWVAIELIAFLFLCGVEGRLVNPAELVSERLAVASDESSVDRSPPGAAPALVGPGVAVRTLHPFLGFTRDPSVEPPRMREIPWLVDPHGFVRRPGSRPLSDVGGGVAVLGGSVALQFNLLAGPELARLLAGDERWPNAPEITNLSMGAWKQPQQLMALNWMLALGVRPDAVVNIDGFNEIALSSARHARGQYPYYPESWEALTRETLDPQLAQQVGRVEYLGQERRELARALSIPGFSRSPFLNLVWLRLDRLALRRLEGARENLGEYESAAGGPRPGALFRGDASEQELLEGVAAVWRRSSLQMHRLCEAEGIDYYHFLQPNQYVPGSKPMAPRERSRVYREHGPYRRAIEAGYPLLIREGARVRRQGVAFHDLTDLFSETREATYSDDCCHLNRRGNQLMAERIARIMRSDGGRAPHSTPRAGR